MASETTMLFVPVGENAARPFGMTARDRACRLATNAGFECADSTIPGRAALLASMAYGWDPAWLKEMRNRPGTVLTLGGKPVMAHMVKTGHLTLDDVKEAEQELRRLARKEKSK